MSGTHQPPIRAYMHNLTVMTSSVPRCRWLLQGLERLIVWARMSFNPARSRSLVIRKGRVTSQFHFATEDTTIPSVVEKLVKSLGKVYNSDLKDTAARQACANDLNTWLMTVEKGSQENSRLGSPSTGSYLVFYGPSSCTKSQSPPWSPCTEVVALVAALQSVGVTGWPF